MNGESFKYYCRRQVLILKSRSNPWRRNTQQNSQRYRNSATISRWNMWKRIKSVPTWRINWKKWLIKSKYFKIERRLYHKMALLRMSCGPELTPWSRKTTKLGVNMSLRLKWFKASLMWVRVKKHNWLESIQSKSKTKII